MYWHKTAAATLLLGAGLLLAAAVAAEPASRPMKIGVVRLQTVLDKLKEKTAIDTRLEAKAQQVTEELAALKEEVDKLEKDLGYSNLAPDSPERAKKQEELKNKQRELQAHYKVQTGAFRTERLRAVQKLYDKIIQQVEQYGKEHQYDLILRGSEQDNKEADDSLEMNLRIVERVVLYAPDADDVSDKVADLMNAQYAKQNEKPEEPK